MNREITKKQPRIAIVIASLKTGGAERMALALAHALLTSGTDIRFFCLDADRTMQIPGTEPERKALEERIRILGESASKRSTLSKTLGFPLLHFRLEKAIRAEGIDLVISFMERANILNLLGNRKVPRIISIRKHPSMGLSDKDPLKRFLVKAGYSWLLQRAYNINFNSEEAAKDLGNLYPRNRTPVSVINNFFDDAMSVRGQEALTPEEQEFLSGQSILTCGRLVPVKAHASLIRAFSKVAAAVPKSKLIIVGGGPLQPELEQLSERLQLSDRVYFTGFKVNPYSWVSRCRLFVLSSKSEGFPNALLEAMALGRPVISTDCRSGPRELLSPGSDPSKKTDTLDMAQYGALTPPQENPEPASTLTLSPAEEILAQALERFISDRQVCENYGKLSKQRANEFRKENILGEWCDLIKDALPNSTLR